MSDDPRTDWTQEMLDKRDGRTAVHYTYGQVQAMKEAHASEVEALRRERDEWHGRAADRCNEAEKWFRKYGEFKDRAEKAEAALAAVQGETP